jgi:hypothetical protein
MQYPGDYQFLRCICAATPMKKLPFGSGGGPNWQNSIVMHGIAPALV